MANEYIDKITLNNGTTYDIKGGTQLYRHVIYAYKDTKGEITQYDIVIINTDSTPITKTTFENKLKNCVGYYGYKGTGGGATYQNPLVGFNSTYLCWYGSFSDKGTFSDFASEEYDTFTDTVTAL